MKFIQLTPCVHVRVGAIDYFIPNGSGSIISVGGDRIPVTESVDYIVAALKGVKPKPIHPNLKPFSGEEFAALARGKGSIRKESQK